MEGMKKKLLPIALFASGSSLFSQTVCTGTVEQCCEAPKQLCANEKAPAKMKCNEQDCFEGARLQPCRKGLQRDRALAPEGKS